MNQIIIQGVGYIALLFVLLSFQKNNRVAILLFMMIGLMLFALHYSLLGAWTGAILNFLEAGMVFVGYKKDSVRWAQSKIWPYFFILLFVVAGFVTFKSLWDFLPVLAQTFATIGVWHEKPKSIRLFMLIPRPLWFVYNFMVGSYAGVTAEIILLASVLIGIIRFDILGKSVKTKK